MIALSGTSGSESAEGTGEPKTQEWSPRLEARQW
jgi:hypothetical protein